MIAAKTIPDINCDLPLVSINIPTYNAEATIHKMLESILTQTYSNLVLHIVDNASTDDTLNLIEEFKDERINIHRHNLNVGAEGNFNRCIQLAEGKYTAIFHADDIYEPDIIAKQVAFLEDHLEAGAVFTEASIIDENANRTGEIRLPKDIVAKCGLYDFVTMFKAVLNHSNFFICPSVMVRTQVYKQEIKCWRGELFKSSADLDLWFQILQNHSIGYLQERLMSYRISVSQFSAKVRLDTERSDFFLVMDHYLAQKSVQSLLNQQDYKNFRCLQRRDQVGRAINCILTDRSADAVQLTKDILSWEVLKAALQSKRGFFVLIMGVVTWILARFCPYRIGKAPLQFLKSLIRR